MIDRSLPWAYRPQVVADPAGLFEQVVAEVAWTDQMWSRRTASMGRPYNYAGASYADEAPWHPAVWALGEALIDEIGFVPTNCLLNLYPTGEHGMGWHADDTTILEQGTGIAIISLGAVRTLQLRRGTAPDFVYERLALEPGSLLWMSQDLQHTHKHGIKRETGAGTRVSLTYRRIVRASAVVENRPWGRG